MSETVQAPLGPAEVRLLISGILKRVSRSFYITLRVLPRDLRIPVGLAYLMARAADTISDTTVIPLEQRLGKLQRFRGLFNGAVDGEGIREIQSAMAETSQLPAERALLTNLDRCFALYGTLPNADRRLIGEVVGTLTSGMEKDLRRFPGQTAAEIRALQTPEELDEYAYLVAGCVGPFWTKISRAHLPALKNWDEERACALGIRFGKALQLTNILRDLPRDLRAGRCYLPASELAAIRLTPQDLLNPLKSDATRPLYHQWLDTAHGHYEAACRYTLSIPRTEGRLRLSCIWPIWIGLETIALLRGAADFLNPDQVLKISRRRVYQIMAESVLRAGSDRLLHRRFSALLAAAK